MGEEKVCAWGMTRGGVRKAGRKKYWESRRNRVEEGKVKEEKLK